MQLSLGLITLPFSLSHSDGSVMLALSEWAQRIVTLNPDASGIAHLDWPYKIHMVLGMTISCSSPSAASCTCGADWPRCFIALRPYQVVRGRRMNVPK